MIHMDYFVESKHFKDLYILPSKDEQKVIVYAPLRGIAFSSDLKTADMLIRDDESSKEIKQLANKIKGIKINSDFHTEDLFSISRNLVILLSNSCNLGCTYCYAQQNRRDDVLSKEKIRAAIDYVFKLHVDDKNELDVSFLGGGEPMFHWDLLTWAILYVKEQAQKLNLNVRYGFPTNGTLLNEDRIRFLSENNVQVGLSFDILPSIQDTQRPFAHSQRSTYDVVRKNMDLLNQYGIPTRFRTTITPKIASKMPEMVLHTVEHFPYVKKVHFEPIYPLEDDKSQNNDLDAFYDEFIESFMNAYKVGLSFGIQVNTAATNTLNKIKQRYCRGELCVTPNGDIVMCHRASSREDIRFAALNYGSIENEVRVNMKNLSSIQDQINDLPEKCNECFSRWHCAGMCISNRMMYSDAHYKSYCRYIRKLQSIFIENLIDKGGV